MCTIPQLVSAPLNPNFFSKSEAHFQLKSHFSRVLNTAQKIRNNKLVQRNHYKQYVKKNIGWQKVFICAELLFDDLGFPSHVMINL